MVRRSSVTIEEVRDYWDKNPLCASGIPHPIGSPEYFSFYDGLREANETPEFSCGLHEYRKFAGKRVLDVGCGNGYVLERYAREGAEVFGVDITETAVDLCRKRFALSGQKGDFRVADAESLPFGDGSFDCVCSMGVLHHTPRPDKAVAEIHRVLAAGGMLIVMFYHRNSLYHRVGMPLRWLLTGKPVRRQVDEVDGIGNPKGDVFSRKELAELLSRFSGLEFFSGLLTGEMILPVIGKALFPGSVLKRLERRFGWFLYAKAVKP
ncbi:MAG: methyltransferase domain-containing protein [Deltaproteobacteria bacterium]|nr:methyltransferase domain-containing protein [Deltaproteobacteria bacterium]